MTVWAIVVAAGRGERFGGPKLDVALAGRAVLTWSLAAARSVAEGVVAVLPPGEEGRAVPEADRVVAGGDTRSASVRAGLDAVPDVATVIVVHDAARPAADPSLFRAVVAAVEEGADGAVPGIQVVDTVKRVLDGTVVETLERSELVAVQTPQAFAAAWLRRAHRIADDGPDDAALVERAGGKVVVVPGDPRNRKLTTVDDLASLEAALR